MDRSSPKNSSLSWFLGLLWLALPLAHAQGDEARLELRFSSSLALTPFQSGLAWSLGGHLEARYNPHPLALYLVLDPGISFTQPVLSDAGLTELYLLYRAGPLDLSLGLERLPLETARLSLPFSLEPTSPLGLRQGRWGARVSWSPEATRWRLAFLENAGQLVPLLSLRREFVDFDLEAHALYLTRWVLGLGGSGSLADSLWTLEGGYAALPSLPVGPFLAGQWLIPQAEEARWSLEAALWLGPSWQSLFGAHYLQSQPDYDLTAYLRLALGSPVSNLSLGISMRVFLTTSSR